jgi:hypothetical protein
MTDNRCSDINIVMTSIPGIEFETQEFSISLEPGESIELKSTVKSITSEADLIPVNVRTEVAEVYSNDSAWFYSK